MVTNSPGTTTGLKILMSAVRFRPLATINFLTSLTIFKPLAIRDEETRQEAGTQFVDTQSVMSRL